MIKTLLSALAITLPLGAAFGQSANVNRLSSEVDVHAPSLIGGSPGTIGAMDAASRGIATSADDVVMQQLSHSTAAEGHRPIRTRSAIVPSGYSPGTVGSTPGDTPSVERN